MSGNHEGLSLDDVWVTAETRVLLRGVSLHLTEKSVALLGCNGAGKSTLLKLLSGVITPTSGSLTINGLDEDKSAGVLHKKVAFVCSDPLSQLKVTPSAAELEQPLRHFINAAPQDDTIVLDAIKSFGLRKLAWRSVYELSGGERQLLCLVRSLATNPEIVVIDEPSILMDRRNRLQVRRLLGSLRQQLIIATHDLDLAAESERVIVLHDGAVVFDGPPNLGATYFTEMCADFAKCDDARDDNLRVH